MEYRCLLFSPKISKEELWFYTALGLLLTAIMLLGWTQMMSWIMTREWSYLRQAVIHFSLWEHYETEPWGWGIYAAVSYAIAYTGWLIQKDREFYYI